jgi:hypothetical protein
VSGKSESYNNITCAHGDERSKQSLKAELVPNYQTNPNHRADVQGA